MHQATDQLRHELVVLAYSPSGSYDGIQAYTQQLATALEENGRARVALWNPRTESVADAINLMRGVRAARASIVVQYNPFSFAHWGFAPWLPLKLWRLKRKARAALRLETALMVHETFMPTTSWRTALMGAWQHVQLIATRAACDLTLTSITTWRDELASEWPTRPTVHMPVSSNLPDMRARRAAARYALGIDEDTVVLAAFGSNHPSRMMGHVLHAARSVAASGQRAVLLNLGFNVSALDAGPRVPVITPGKLSDDEVAAHLAAADIFLAPFIDGVSTRRTTVMAALQHGLPVVSTDGELTDEVFRQAGGLMLTDPNDLDGFASRATLLARDHAARRTCAQRARELFESEFDWSLISTRLLHALARPQESQCA